MKNGKKRRLEQRSKRITFVEEILKTLLTTSVESTNEFLVALANSFAFGDCVSDMNGSQLEMLHKHLDEMIKGTER